MFCICILSLLSGMVGEIYKILLIVVCNILIMCLLIVVIVSIM